MTIVWLNNSLNIDDHTCYFVIYWSYHYVFNCDIFQLVMNGIYIYSPCVAFQAGNEFNMISQ